MQRPLGTKLETCGLRSKNFGIKMFSKSRQKQTREKEKEKERPEGELYQRALARR